MTSEKNRRVRRWITSGPGDSDSIAERTLAMMLWWRMYALMALLAASLFPGLYVYQHYGHAEGVLAAWISAWFAGFYAMKISPKYNVTKNY